MKMAQGRHGGIAKQVRCNVCAARNAQRHVVHVRCCGVRRAKVHGRRLVVALLLLLLLLLLLPLLSS